MEPFLQNPESDAASFEPSATGRATGSARRGLAIERMVYLYRKKSTAFITYDRGVSSASRRRLTAKISKNTPGSELRTDNNVVVCEGSRL